MEHDNITIRTARAEDADALLAIYAPYVEQTAVTFEYDVPSPAEFRARICCTLERYPYLIAEENGTILGYAYASPFHSRPAYAWGVETSIYIDQKMRQNGIGRLLYGALEAVLREQNVLNLNACIAYPAQPDEHLTGDSVEFHRRMGYRMVGEFFQCGYKFGKWYNMVWMEKHIGDHVPDPAPVKAFPDVRPILNERCGIE